MAVVGQVVPEGQQSKEGFHGLRRTTEGLLYYTKIDKDNTDTIDLSNGVPNESIQLPTSGGHVDFDETLINIQYYAGDNSTTAFSLTQPVVSADRIRVYVNNILMKEGVDFTYTSPAVTFFVKPSSGAQVVIGHINKLNKQNTTDKYWQYLFEDGDATYFIDSDAYLVKRENRAYNPSATSDDYSTAEGSTYSVAATSYQDAV